MNGTVAAKALSACRHKDKSPHAERAATSATEPKFQDGWKRPKHVENCWNRREAEGLTLEDQDWWVWSWRVGDEGSKTRRPYTCGSWRCGGKCATHAAHVLYSRLEEAISRGEYEPDGWVFAVLTLDRLGTRGGQKWPSVREAYRSLGTMSERFLKRLRRFCDREYGTTFGASWVMVVESHRSGWPHANLLVYCPELAAALQEESDARQLAGFAGRQLTILAHQHEQLGGGIRGELGRHAVETGWGIESTAERCRSREALAGYLVKLSRRPDQTLGELAKITQLPLGAPFRFRRLRSGKGFLPPVRKNPGFTGALVKRVADDRGIKHPVVPVPRGGHGERTAVVWEVERLEEFVLRHEELAAWARIRGRRARRSSPIPPVSLWMNGVLQRRPRGPPLRKAGTQTQAELWDAARHEAYLLLATPVVDAKAF